MSYTLYDLLRDAGLDTMPDGALDRVVRATEELLARKHVERLGELEVEWEAVHGEGQAGSYIAGVDAGIRMAMRELNG